MITNFSEKLRNLNIGLFIITILTFFRHKNLNRVFMIKLYKMILMKILIFSNYKIFNRNSNKMEKNLYIDASHPNETRIVLKSENSIEEYEFEDKNNLNFKNNIYLATISRVEPSFKQPLSILVETDMVF